MTAKLHFVSGKGGTGKSTFAAALATVLASDPQNLPILTIDIQGSGQTANLLGIQNPQYKVRPSLSIDGVWGCKIMPQESFQEYFARSLFPDSIAPAFGEASMGIREKLVGGIFSNSIVKSFIEVCPGLEPSAMLGKIHFEATEGLVPETNQGWKHVIVDAPSTGHFLALFSSIEALTRVFSAGTVLRQASQIFNFVRNPNNTQIYLMTLPSQLPAQETLDLKADLAKRGLSARNIIVNRMRPHFNFDEISLTKNPEWDNFLSVEKEIYSEEQEVVAQLSQELGPEDRIVQLPETLSQSSTSVTVLADALKGKLP